MKYAKKPKFPACSDTYPGHKKYGSDNQMCSNYKKLSAKADNDKVIEQEECGKMTVADSECANKYGWFSMKKNDKGYTRCYCCKDS